MRTEAQKAAEKRYNDKNVYYQRVKLNKQTDKDIIDWINEQENKNGAIKAAIREQIKK